MTDEERIDEERIKEKLIGAKLTAEGQVGENPIVVSFTGALESLLYLAIYALADVTVEIIKKGFMSESEKGTFLRDIHANFVTLTETILDENLKRKKRWTM